MGSSPAAAPARAARGHAESRGWEAPAIYALAILPPLLAGVTYRSWIDGSPATYALSLGLSAAAALVVAGWALAGGRGRLLAATLAVAFAILVPAVHVARALQRNTPLQVSLRSMMEYGNVLDVNVSGTSSFRLENDALVLSIPAGSLGFAELRLPQPSAADWAMPRALFQPDDARVAEEVRWRENIVRERDHVVLVDADRVVVQSAAWGLLVTSPGLGGEVTTASISLPLENGVWRDWALRRQNGRLTLLAGDKPVWSTSQPEPLKIVRLGETRTDVEHGGTLRLASVRYARSRG